MWETIRLNVTNDLIAIQKQTKFDTLYITGISLGGGLAGISYIDIRVENIFKNLHVTTFGAPMVGNKKWVEFFDQVTGGKSYRYFIKGDPIVVLPSCLTALCNYQQTGVQIVCVKEDSCTVGGLKMTTRKQRRDYLTNDVDPSMQNLNSIVDHIEGYPDIYALPLIGTK